VAGELIEAHLQAVTRHYTVRYPAHEPRARDPHGRDFHAWKRHRKTAGTWTCDFAVEHRGGDTSECDLTRPLEAHHRLVELALLNSIDLALLERDFPGISANSVGAWINSDGNLQLLCVAHHRGAGGVHTASASDFGSEFYVRDLISASGGHG
jgi:hypothetical protein